MTATEKKAAAIVAVLPVGRDNAITIGQLRVELHKRTGIWLGDSTVRAYVHRLQEAGVKVLSSPRAGGVWLAEDEQETMDVLEELRAQVHAVERRMQLINGGRCALASCRAELTETTLNRGGLYCCQGHRYQAAAERAS
ncbi:MAG: hypothetical protein GY898_23085 [Proteobacteria bacterium]|nr:hypothetical protein [Pseudomonadota bacterium]